LLTLWLIGSTIAKIPNKNAPLQSCLLGGIGYVQVIFLIWQQPFMEYLENYIQAVVNGCQGSFFLLLGLGQYGIIDSPQGSTLNNCNLIAMTLLVPPSPPVPQPCYNVISHPPRFRSLLVKRK
jgi:hypothetical protein